MPKITAESTPKVPRNYSTKGAGKGKKRMAIPDRFMSRIQLQAEAEQLEPYYILVKWLETAESVLFPKPKEEAAV